MRNIPNMVMIYESLASNLDFFLQLKRKDLSESIKSRDEYQVFL
jgi:hypothetical protein